MRDDVKPVQQKLRRLPFSVRDDVSAELKCRCHQEDRRISLCVASRCDLTEELRENMDVYRLQGAQQDCSDWLLQLWYCLQAQCSEPADCLSHLPMPYEQDFSPDMEPETVAAVSTLLTALPMSDFTDVCSSPTLPKGGLHHPKACLQIWCLTTRLGMNCPCTNHFFWEGVTE